MEVRQIETTTHGRVLIRTRTDPGSAITLVGFHGYAQSADEIMDVLQRIPGSERWTLMSVQALNRFYTRGDQKIVASWMTRQDREYAIADNIAYVDRVLANDAGERPAPGGGKRVVLGFSQGVAMAYRAALLGRARVDGIIAIGGDIPPDVRDVPRERWPKVLIAAGKSDHWYTEDKLSADESLLKSVGAEHDVLRYNAGHEITDEVLAAAEEFTRVLEK